MLSDLRCFLKQWLVFLKYPEDENWLSGAQHSAWHFIGTIIHISQVKKLRCREMNLAGLNPVLSYSKICLLHEAKDSVGGP